jgi:protein-disulfide isomerase
MRNILYANWTGENLGNLSDRRLQAMAESIGLDMKAFNACFSADKYKSEIQADMNKGKDLGVSGTPSVFVNGQKVGQPGTIPTYDEIAQAVNAAAPAP